MSAEHVANDVFGGREEEGERERGEREERGVKRSSPTTLREGVRRRGRHTHRERDTYLMAVERLEGVQSPTLSTRIFLSAEHVASDVFAGREEEGDREESAKSEE